LHLQSIIRQSSLANVARSGSGAVRFRPDLQHLMHADDLAQVAFDEMNVLGRHGFYGDLDMHHVAGSVRPHAVRNQITFGERLQHARQQAGRTLGVEQEAHMDGHWVETPDHEGKKRVAPAVQTAGPLIRVMWIKFDMTIIMAYGLHSVQRCHFALQPGAVRVAAFLGFMQASDNTRRGPVPS
jgi:hypothetical protein